jgi:hypothetical protein
VNVYGGVLVGGSTSNNEEKGHTGRGLPSVAAEIIFGGERERLGGDMGGFDADRDGE